MPNPGGWKRFGHGVCSFSRTINRSDYTALEVRDNRQETRDNPFPISCLLSLVSCLSLLFQRRQASLPKRHSPAIHVKDLAGDVGSLVACQERHRVGNI